MSIKSAPPTTAQTEHDNKKRHSHEDCALPPKVHFVQGPPPPPQAITGTTFAAIAIPTITTCNTIFFIELTPFIVD